VDPRSFNIHNAGEKFIPVKPEFPPEATILRMGMNTYSMSRNYATDLALFCNVSTTSSI
jgi:hypothetical protein